MFWPGGGQVKILIVTPMAKHAHHKQRRPQYPDQIRELIEFLDENYAIRPETYEYPLTCDAKDINPPHRRTAGKINLEYQPGEDLNTVSIHAIDHNGYKVQATGLLSEDEVAQMDLYTSGDEKVPSEFFNEMLRLTTQLQGSQREVLLKKWAAQMHEAERYTFEKVKGDPMFEYSWEPSPEYCPSDFEEYDPDDPEPRDGGDRKRHKSNDDDSRIASTEEDDDDDDEDEDEDEREGNKGQAGERQTDQAQGNGQHEEASSTAVEPADSEHDSSSSSSSSEDDSDDNDDTEDEDEETMWKNKEKSKKRPPPDSDDEDGSAVVEMSDSVMWAS